MHETILTDGVPIKTWLPKDEIEPAAMAQLANAATHPDAVEHIAVMPDCHVGYGVTIGCVFPTRYAVIPNAVGVDIGCGMAAWVTELEITDEQIADAKFWRQWAYLLRAVVPTGFRTHREVQEHPVLEERLRATALQPMMDTKAAIQFGTLGGGNHFLEAQVTEDNRLAFMVHSGSRHLGLRIAGHYTELAKAETISRKRSSTTPKDLDALEIDSTNGRDYWHDMMWATRFARASRARMLWEMVNAYEYLTDIDLMPRESDWIDTPHNAAWQDGYTGTVLHRKGATPAGAGESGIIPGSMGTPSCIVQGKGNPDSFRSCSHGAGRVIGRKAAKRTFTQEQIAEALAGTHSEPSMGIADEAPMAYKDIQTVIDRQSDLIDVVHRLRPIITVKGDSRAKDD